MKILKIVVVILILIMSAGAVCAADSLSDDYMVQDGQKIVGTVQDDAILEDLEKTQDDIYKKL